MKNALSFDVAADKSGEPKWNQLFVLGRFFRQDFPKGIEFTTEVFESMVSNWWPQGAQSWRSTISTGARLTSPTCPSRARLHRGGSPTCASTTARSRG